MPDGLLGPLFGSSDIQTIFGEHGRLQGMLDFEAALAKVEGRLNIIPSSAAEAIAAMCHAGRFDIAALGRDAVLAGNTAIPLIRHLTRAVAQQDPSAARYVHWGATSQDAQDTGLVLQMRAALDWLDNEIGKLCEASAVQAERHRGTLVAGRTWLQHALPITFGLKAAGWLDALMRHRTRLTELRSRALVLQFGGAAGTLASLGERGIEVSEALAKELKLVLPVLPWHTHRDRIAETGTALALLVGTLGKIARDLSLLMQTDVGEAFEPAAPGKGGSSSMPHKRNPVACAVVLSAAVRAPGLAATLLTGMVQEHERGLGGWHSEWTTLPELFDLTAGSLEQMLPVIDGLEVDAARMRTNLETTRGLLLAEAVKMTLAEHIGGPEAHTLVEQACMHASQQKRNLQEVLADDPKVSRVISSVELERLFEPTNYLGSSGRFVNRALVARKTTGSHH